MAQRAVNLIADDFAKAYDGGLIRDGKNNRIKACEFNAKVLLSRAERYAGVHFDEFLGRMRIDGRDWSDHDERAALIFLQCEHRMSDLKLGQVRTAMQSLAYDRRRDSLREYVGGLVWDGTPRIEQALMDGWGAPDTELTRAGSGNLFKALAARAERPGVQVDTLWAFEGPQGVLKSRAFRELGREWHAEISAPVGTPDFQRETRGLWIGELAEFDSLRGREASTAKRVLSAVQDRFVEKYEKHATAYPRRVVFVATTNEAQYWQDHTGARRLVPIKVGEIRIDVIAENREQWFAEAKHRLDAGETWWEFPTAIREAQDERQQVDPWEDLLQSLILNGRKHYVTPEIAETIYWPTEWISSAEIMRDWLRLAPHQQGSNCGVRLGRVMRRMGFETKRQGKAGERGWVRKADTGGNDD